MLPTGREELALEGRQGCVLEAPCRHVVQARNSVDGEQQIVRAVVVAPRLRRVPYVVERAQPVTVPGDPVGQPIPAREERVMADLHLGHVRDRDEPLSDERFEQIHLMLREVRNVDRTTPDA